MQLYFLIILILAVILTVFISYWVFSYRAKKKINYMLDALEDGETNFRFWKRGSFTNLNKPLNRLRDIFDKEMQFIRERERYYAQLLDTVQTGIVVVENNLDRIVYSNQKARELIGLSSLSSLRQLSNIDSSLYEAFIEVSEDANKQVTYYDERGQKRISISANIDSIDNKWLKIIVFNDISSTIDQTESESWTKLIRVLTHEIMNTVTPIASLSEALQNVKESSELKLGLETISSSSRGLIKFVESYRNLTRVAMPIKKAILVKDLVYNVLGLTEQFLSGYGTIARFEEKTEDTLIYADGGQISQILINLIKNAAQAGASKVTISSEIDLKDNVIISISNNGEPISLDAQKQIFVPFFTTKQDGTGIGLSLSRQIMLLHGGKLRLVKSDEESTVFELIFS